MSAREHDRFVEVCLEGAREHERQARSLRALARKVKTPPIGTHVAVCGNIVRFITPVREESPGDA